MLPEKFKLLPSKCTPKGVHLFAAKGGCQIRSFGTLRHRNQLAVSTKEQKKKTTEKRVYLQPQRSPAPTVKRFDGADFQGNQLVRHDLECGYNCGATTSNNCNRSCRFRQHLASVLECSFNFVSTEAYKSYVLSNSTMFIPRVLVRQIR